MSASARETILSYRMTSTQRRTQRFDPSPLPNVRLKNAYEVELIGRPRISAQACGPRPRIALIAGSLDRIGGQEVQAKILFDHLRQEGYSVDFIPINPAFPQVLKW